LSLPIANELNEPISVVLEAQEGAAEVERESVERHPKGLYF